MIGFIGGLFAGIFSILGKLLPGKKKDYFLDFDDAKGTGQAQSESAPAPQKKAKAAAKEGPKPEQPQPEAKAAKPEPAPKSEKKAQATAAKAQVQTPPAAPVANGKMSAKAAEQVGLFAPNYLLPKPTARRRRPGANMAMFVQMSREMNIRR